MQFYSDNQKLKNTKYHFALPLTHAFPCPVLQPILWLALAREGINVLPEDAEGVGLAQSHLSVDQARVGAIGFRGSPLVGSGGVLGARSALGLLLFVVHVAAFGTLDAVAGAVHEEAGTAELWNGEIGMLILMLH